MRPLRHVFGWCLYLAGVAVGLLSGVALIGWIGNFDSPVAPGESWLAVGLLLLGGAGFVMMAGGRWLRFDGTPPPALAPRMISAGWRSLGKLASFMRGVPGRRSVPLDVELMAVVTRQEWPRHALGRNLCLAAIAYFGAGMVLLIFGDLVLEVLPEDDTQVSALVAVIVPVVAVVAGVIFLKRRDYGVRGVHWLGIGAILLALGAATEAFLPWINATDRVSGQVVYSGPIVEVRRTEKASSRSNTQSGRAGRLLFFPIELITGSWDYLITIEEGVSKRRITFRVRRSEYDAAQEGAMFARTMHRGLLGTPYRWVWE